LYHDLSLYPDAKVAPSRDSFFFLAGQISEHVRKRPPERHSLAVTTRHEFSPTGKESILVLTTMGEFSAACHRRNET
jgi:hypothetical protein